MSLILTGLSPTCRMVPKTNYTRFITYRITTEIVSRSSITNIQFISRLPNYHQQKISIKSSVTKHICNALLKRIYACYTLTRLWANEFSVRLVKYCLLPIILQKHCRATNCDKDHYLCWISDIK